MKKFLCVLTVLFCGLLNNSNATIVFDNGLPDTRNGYSVHGSSSTSDDFSTDVASTIKSVGFYFQNYSGITGWDQNISYEISSNEAGAVGTSLASGTGKNLTAVESDYAWCCGGGNAWLVNFDLASDFNTSAGTKYWLTLSGAGGPASSAWWVTTAPELGSVGESFAFYLSGTSVSSEVPEPATVALMGLGLFGFVASRRKSANSKNA